LERLFVHLSVLEVRDLPAGVDLSTAGIEDIQYLHAADGRISQLRSEGNGRILRSSRVGLRSVNPDDADAIADVVNDPSVSWLLPTRGRFISPDQLLSDLTQDLPHVSIAYERSSGQALTLFALLGQSERNGVGELSFYSLRRSSNPKSGISMEGLALFLSFLFNGLGIRKLLAKVQDCDLPQFAAAEDALLRREGLLKDHVRDGEGFQDVHVFAIWREAWSEVEMNLREPLLGWV
jgi:RimJ/RimL family protein N-acetyltransferase